MPEQTAASILIEAFDGVSRRIDTLVAGIGEIKRELVALSMIAQQATERSSHLEVRVAKLEDRADEHDQWHVVADTSIRVRRETHEDDLAKLNRVREIIGDWLPYGIGAMGVILFILSWDFWPW